MRNGFWLGRILGINVYIDWSWSLIFMIVTLNLAAAFVRLHPAWGLGTIWGIAIMASILFFASVLAHELAHSLVAQAQGLPVRNIKLFLFGGVSNIQREPHSPGNEFIMAAIGPVTSIVLGMIFVFLGDVIAVLGGHAADQGPLATLLLWLGPVNILLGFFNLIPGFPLDGGRVLRSILWAATHNLRQATQWASWVGQAIAWLMIAGGIAMALGVAIPFFGMGLVGGLWLAFIGWFLFNAATQSYRQMLIEGVLEGVTVSSLMQSHTLTVSPEVPVGLLAHENILGADEHAFPVIQNDRLVGLVSVDDVRKVPRDRWDRTAVSQIMTPLNKLVLVTPQDNATEALNELGSHDVHQAPVVQDGRLVGILRHRDIVRWLKLHSDLLKI